MIFEIVNKNIINLNIITHLLNQISAQLNEQRG